MKKLIFSIAIIASYATNAQTVDTAKIKGVSVVEFVTPFTVKWNDTTKAKYLSVRSMSDNLKDRATFAYTLYSATGVRLEDGAVECISSSYKGWSGDNKFPFSFVALKLGQPVK